MKSAEPMKKIIAVIAFLFCISSCNAQNNSNHFLSDQEFFEVLDLDHSGLEVVKKCVKKGDIAKAKKEFVVYLKNRKTPKWYFDWRDFAPSKGYEIKPYIKDYADRHAKNELLAHGTWHKYGDTIDWTVDYSNDHYDEWVWQLNIHSCWVNLAEAYWSTGDEKYAKAFVRQMNSWIDQCSSLNGYWNGAGSVWRPLDAGQRMQRNWPMLLYRFLASSSFDDESIIKMVKSFYQHGVHLKNHPTANNWLTLEMSGLYIVGGLFPEFKEAQEWRSFAANRLYEEEQKLFYPDGAQIELTPGYHAVSVSSMVAVYKFASLNGYSLPEGFVERLENAYEYFVKLRMPDGRMPSVNDSEWIDSKECLSDAANLFPQNRAFRYFSSNGKEGKQPSYTSVWMPWAGWYVMRSGWDKDALYALFEVGPYGSAHQHEDKLSFILYAYGQRLITECGYYSYDKSDWRKYALSARGHNVARVDGKDQNRSIIKDKELRGVITKEEGVRFNYKPLSNVWKSNRKYDLGEGSYTEGFGDDLDSTVIHHRTLRFMKNQYWIVTDTFIPSDTLSHTYDTWFHLNTPSYGTNNKDLVYSDANNSANIAIVSLSGKSSVDVVIGQETPELFGWKAIPGGGNGYHCEPVATPTFHLSGKGIISESYLFIPYKANELMPIKKTIQISKTKYRVYLNDGKKIIVNIE